MLREEPLCDFERGTRIMKCKHCRQKKFLRLSRSKDHWILRLLMLQFVRCHYCNFAFLAPLWHFVPSAGKGHSESPIRRRSAA